MISIRPENSEDRHAIRQVTIDAFSGSDLGHHGEADLIEMLRERCEYRLSLVALDQTHVVGHILFTPALISCDGKEFPGMGLAPLSVLTSHQQQGVGSALLTAGLTSLATADNPFTVVAGHPDYYTRFGFVLASKFGLQHGFAGMPQDVFLIHSHNPNALRSFRGGKVYYQPEFGPQHVGT